MRNEGKTISRGYGRDARVQLKTASHQSHFDGCHAGKSGFIDKAAEITGARQPFSERHAVYVLVELLGASDEQDRAQREAFLEHALEQGQVQDVIVAQSIEHARQLWEYRESVGEMLSRLKPHAAFDVGIPVAAMDGFVRSVEQILQQEFPQQSHLFFGHLGDGNLHLLSGPYPSPATLHAVEEIVYRAVGEVKGSISAENGIGIVKKEFLHFCRSPEEMALMRGLKRLLDPNNVLNAGRILD